MPSQSLVVEWTSILKQHQKVISASPAREKVFYHQANGPMPTRILSVRGVAGPPPLRLYTAWLRSRPVHWTPDPTMLPRLFVVLFSGYTANALPRNENFEIGDTVKDFKDRENSMNFCSTSLNLFLLQVARFQYWWERRLATLSTSLTRPLMSIRRDSQPTVCWNNN